MLQNLEVLPHGKLKLPAMPAAVVAVIKRYAVGEAQVAHG